MSDGATERAKTAVRDWSLAVRFHREDCVSCRLARKCAAGVSLEAKLQRARQALATAEGKEEQ